MIIKIIKRLFRTEVMYSDRPLFVAYVRKNDPQSEKILSILEEISEEDLGLKACSIDADDEPELLERLSINSVPTVICLKNGKQKGRAELNTTKVELLEMLNVK